MSDELANAERVKCELLSSKSRADPNGTKLSNTLSLTCSPVLLNIQ